MGGDNDGDALRCTAPDAHGVDDERRGAGDALQHGDEDGRIPRRGAPDGATTRAWEGPRQGASGPLAQEAERHSVLIARGHGAGRSTCDACGARLSCDAVTTTET